MANDFLDDTCGLAPSTTRSIKKVFAEHPSVERVLLYGSRAKGNFRHASDIDLTILGDVAFEELLRIQTELDDLLLPYKIDLSVLHDVTAAALREHIQRVGKTFYRRDGSTTEHSPQA